MIVASRKNIMKKINASKTLESLSGEKIRMSDVDPTAFTVGKAMANYLISGKSRKWDSLKNMEMAKKFYAEGEIEVDDADAKTLRDIVSDTQLRDVYSDLIVGQLILAME